MQTVGNVRIKIGNWKIDDDGFMKVRAVILKEGVFDYLESELSDTSDSDRIIKVFIPASAFNAEALTSGEGMHALEGEHDWLTIKDWKSKKVIGNVAGNLEVKGNKIYCDVILTDADAIEKVKNKDLVEISAGYTCDFIKEAGEYNLTPYEYRQDNIIFNHIVFLPVGQGRCGHDVRVVNKKQEREEKMSIKIRYRVGNSDRTKEFTNEDDARKAEEMTEEVRESKDIDVKNALEKFEEMKKEVETKNAELEEARKEIEAVKKQIEDALSPEAQEALADEIIEQRKAEDEIIDEEFEKEEKEDVKNACRAMNRAARALFLARKVLNKRGVNADDLSEEHLLGAFTAIAAEAHHKVANKKPQSGGVVIGAKAFNSVSASTSNREAIKRMFGKK